MKKRVVRRRIHWVCAASWFVLLSAGVAAEPTSAGDAGKTNAVALIDDYSDFQQLPIRNAELRKLMDEAELVAVVQLDLAKLTAAKPATNVWAATIVPAHPFREGFAGDKFKGNCGRQIMMQGDLKAFANAAPQHISQGCFGEANQFLVFLKAVDTNGVYRCLEANPGGFRMYAGRDGSDHRRMLAGRVNGALVVEALRGYHGARMCGPTNMRDLQEGMQTGLQLTAAAKGGATVELRFENMTRRPISIPKDIKLFAPLLWAEVEGRELDEALLSPHDYVNPKFTDPYAEMQTIAPSNAVTVTVELPTGPVPKGATLRFALNNHVKPLAGSLPAGPHEVRMLFRPTNETIVMSNAVKVEGKAGGAGRAEVAAVPGFPAYEPATNVVKGLPPLKNALEKGEVKGEIWFDSNREGNWEIYRMDVNGSNVVNVTQTSDADEIEVRVSPDGRRIVYKRGPKGLGRGGFWGRTSNDGWTFRLADRDGGNAMDLADAAGGPAWWDSHTLMYGSKTNGLCLRNLDTGETRGGLLKGVGSWLRGAGGALATGTHQLLSGGGPHTVLNGVTLTIDLDANAEFKGFTPVTRCYRGCTQRWASPEGRRIIYAHHDPKHGGAIILWTIKPDGSEPARFPVPGAGWEGYGAYCESPDGTMFVAASWGNIYVGRCADGAQVQLTNRQGENYSPEWHRGARGVQEHLLSEQLKAAGGSKDEVARLCRKFMKDNAGNEYAQLAGLGLLTATEGERAFGELANAMGECGGQTRAAVRALAAGLTGEGIGEKWVAELKKAKPAARAGILEVLAERGDKAVLPVAKKSLADENEPARIAAITAVARLGGKDEIPELVKKLGGGTPGEQAAVETELVRMADRETGAAVAGAMEKAAPGVQTALLGVLARRGETGQVDVVLAAISGKEEAVRPAAWKAAGALAGENALPRLIGPLVQAGTEGERQAAEEAIRAVSDRVKDGGKCVEAALAALNGAPVPGRCSILRLLGRIGGAKALEAVQAAVKSENADVQETAVGVLAGWKTVDAADSLMGIVRGGGKESQRLLAHQGYTRLLGLPGERKPEEALAMHKAGLETALRPEEKILLLTGLGRIKSVEALKVAEPYFEDTATQTTAGSAMVSIAAGISAAHKDEAKAAVKKVIARAGDNALKTAAQNALGQMEMYEDYIVAWKVAGPYTQEGKDGTALFDTAFPPEDPEAKNVEWKPVLPGTDPAAAWQIDLARIVGGENRAAYLRTVVESTEDQEVLLELGSDDGIKVWLNGKVIHANNTGRGVRPAEDKVKTALKAGPNTLLLKITQGSGGWGACARFRKADGSRLEGLKVKAE